MLTQEILPADSQIVLAAQSSFLASFECGNEFWEREVADWIKGQSVIDTMEQRQTVVYFYYTDARDFMGYGTLSYADWHHPRAEDPTTRVASIPALALASQFHGGCEVDGRRFSDLIIGDLVARARGETTYNDLVLLVHEQNKRGRRVYERNQFALMDSSLNKRGHVYNKMTLELR
jgi:hypothetical protein